MRNRTASGNDDAGSDAGLVLELEEPEAKNGAVDDGIRANYRCSDADSIW